MLPRGVQISIVTFNLILHPTPEGKQPREHGRLTVLYPNTLPAIKKAL